MNNLKKTDSDKIKQDIRKAQKEIEKNKEQIRNDIKKMKAEKSNETTGIISNTKVAVNTQFPEKNRLFFLI